VAWATTAPLGVPMSSGAFMRPSIAY
jgi:hypothetical protein